MKVYQGTEIKLNVNIEPMLDVSMESYDFKVEIYTFPSKVLTFNKSDAIRVDSNNYIVLVDTSLLGEGDVKCKVTAHIPDDDFKDGFRTEIAVTNVGINIVK